ncbi:unnamed protein product, partial [Linum tenue]
MYTRALCVSFSALLLTIPVTYAGGVTVIEDLERIRTSGKGRVDVTMGSTLDIFGGNKGWRLGWFLLPGLKAE